MKKRNFVRQALAWILCLGLLLSVAACADGSDTAQTDALGRARAWLETQIKNDTLFSFVYDGKAFSEFIGGWEKKTGTGTDESGNPVYTLTYISPDGVTVWADIVLDEEFAALDWVCYFKNDAAGDSKVISDILPLDTTVQVDNPALTTASDGSPTAAGFEPIFVDLTEKPEYNMASNGGRSSLGAFPYYDISNGEYGVVGAIGWTGQWRAAFVHDTGSVSMQAGMAKTRIALRTGEEMRTPSMLLLFFDGDQDAGHNRLRRLILKSYTPADETGQPLQHLSLIYNAWGGASEDTLMGLLDYADQIGYDEYEIFWVDAGWHGNAVAENDMDQTWAQMVGNWYANPTLLPDGFINISQRLDESGKELLVWFEPERVVPGTKLALEHPEYLLAKTDATSFYLYNLPSDEATDYLINLIDNLIKENGIRWYRQDFNCNPYETWIHNDTLEGDDRVGMTEIKYITNYYRYLDTLFARNPGLMMDNCASGGLRLDIEMMKRSVPLWRTDYTVGTGGPSSTADGVRNIGYNLTWWLPLSVGGRSQQDGVRSTYAWRCGQIAGLVFGNDQLSVNSMRPLIAQYLRCRELINGDYYILSAGRGGEYTAKTAVYEFYVPEKGEGYLMVFRPSGSRDESLTVALKGLDPDAVYTLEDADTGQTTSAEGRALMENGLTITIDRTGASSLIFITRQ